MPFFSFIIQEISHNKNFQYMLKKALIVASLASTFLVSSIVNAALPAPNVPVNNYILVDATTGTVLAEKNADAKVKIASVTKIMTAYVAFKELKNGAVSLSDDVKIRKEAYERNGSKMFLEIGSNVKFEELIKGLLAVSGNDAATAIAQHVSGNEERFAQLMNAYAQDIGMHNSYFTNASGLDKHTDPYSTARDLSILTRRLVREFPEYYHYFSIKSFTHNGIPQPNRNALIHESDNYTGLKTGYTRKAKFCMASTYKKGERELIAIVLGAKNPKERFKAVRTLTKYGLRFFVNMTPIDKNQKVFDYPVLYGDANSVPVYPAETFSFSMPATIGDIADHSKKILLLVKFNDNKGGTTHINAPIKAGEDFEVGTISVKYGKEIIKTVPLITRGSVKEAGALSKAKDYIYFNYLKLVDK